MGDNPDLPDFLPTGDKFLVALVSDLHKFSKKWQFFLSKWLKVKKLWLWVTNSEVLERCNEVSITVC